MAFTSLSSTLAQNCDAAISAILATSSIKAKDHLLSMVLELPPAPAALVLLGRRFAVFSARSAAAFLRITVAGPPGGLGEVVRPVVEAEAVLGEVARAADCRVMLAIVKPRQM